jgi:hypothetical protein
MRGNDKPAAAACRHCGDTIGRGTTWERLRACRDCFLELKTGRIPHLGACRKKGHVVPGVEEPDPSQENAIRCLEDVNCDGFE